MAAESSTRIESLTDLEKEWNDLRKKFPKVCGDENELQILKEQLADLQFKAKKQAKNPRLDIGIQELLLEVDRLLAYFVRNPEEKTAEKPVLHNLPSTATEVKRENKANLPSIVPSSGGMFSRLVFTIDNEEITFEASELLCIAHQITMAELAAPSPISAKAVPEDEKRTAVPDNKITLPNHAAADKLLDDKFWQFTYALADSLEKAYGVRGALIRQFLVDIYVDPNRIFHHFPLLDYIKTKTKTPCFKVQIDEHIVIPMQLIQTTTIKQWMAIAKHLSANYLQQESIAGWWFRIGSRVIRLRNDVEEGAVRENNKQFYASDHGSELNIFKNTQREIERCINNFTWGEGDEGNYFRAFKFWQYFILSDLKELEIEFVERITDDILRNDEACQKLFSSLENPPERSPPKPISIPKNLSAQEISRRKNIFMRTFLDNIRQISSTAKNWIEIKFITDLTEEIAASEAACGKLLSDCWHSYFYSDISVRYENLPDSVKKERKRKFAQIFKFYLERHQSSLRKEFIARVDDAIAASPQKCQLLLLSLAHPFDNFRGTVEENNWQRNDHFCLGDRDRVDAPEISHENRAGLSEAQILRYGAIFDDLIEQFRYVTEAILKYRVLYMKEFSLFHTQIRQITHRSVADNYIVAHILCELAKAINHGEHEPLFRELSAYGDREAGDSYQKFERVVSEYLRKPRALSESALAAKMRAILGGAPTDTEDLAFLPCLTASWFISETVRNPLTTMTSLMLLDMIESGVVAYTSNGDNWYTWRNALIHPQKGDGVGKVRDLYGSKINIDEFGSCHPMVHQGSVAQTTEPPSYTAQLNIARQKEGNLIIHWLQLMIEESNEANKNKLQKVSAQRIKDLPKESPAQSKSIDEAAEEKALVDEKARKEKKRDKAKGTIRSKLSKDENANIKKQEDEIANYEKEILDIDQKLRSLRKKVTLKKQLQTNVIEPLLKLRLSSLTNLLKSAQPVPMSVFHDAILAGNLGLVNALLVHNINLNESDTDGNTPLILAARAGHTAIVARLLARGANINHQDKFGNTALHYAATNTHITAVSTLLSHPTIQADLTNIAGHPAYHYICDHVKHGHSQYVKIAKCFQLYYKRAKQKKISPNDKAKLLHGLVKNKKSTVLKKIKTLVKRGANIFWHNEAGLIASQIAQQEGNEAVFKFLRNKEFELIEKAIATDNLQELQLLLKNGAGINLLNPTKIPIADVAMSYHNQTAFAFIRALGLNVPNNKQRKKDSTPPSSNSLPKEEKIGPRKIPGWLLEDVDDQGNCFYDAVVHQMVRMDHPFLKSVPAGTAYRDSLRLCVQGAEFEDEEWADHAEIEALARKLNCIVAIVNTRDPTERFVYHFIDADGNANSTPDITHLPPRFIIKLAFTGNHYLSVVKTRLALTEAPTSNASSNPTLSTITPPSAKAPGDLSGAFLSHRPTERVVERVSTTNVTTAAGNIIDTGIKN